LNNYTILGLLPWAACLLITIS